MCAARKTKQTIATPRIHRTETSGTFMTQGEERRASRGEERNEKEEAHTGLGTGCRGSECLVVLYCALRYSFTPVHLWVASRREEVWVYTAAPVGCISTYPDLRLVVCLSFRIRVPQPDRWQTTKSKILWKPLSL